MPDLITTDIDNFWRAFDAADRLPTSDRVKIFTSAYYDVASRGMRDFIDIRLGDVENFEKVVTFHDQFYRSTRAMMRIREFEAEIRHFYRRFRDLYRPLETFNVTFVVGRMGCGGTTSESGLLIGAEMFGRTDRTPLDTLNHWHRAVIRPMSEVPSMVIHELVHKQQKGRSVRGDSVLAASVREGMAVLLTELVTRREDTSAPHEYGRLHESELWEEFESCMDGKNVNDWVGNGDRSVDRPADLGYFIGCQICRAYVRRFGKSGETIARLLAVEDYEEVFRESGYAG
jgi:hypothetical protein